MSPVPIRSRAFLFLLFLHFSIRFFSPVRRLRRAEVLYREPVALPGTDSSTGRARSLSQAAKLRPTPVVAQYPVIAPFASTKACKRSGIERMAFCIASFWFWFSQAPAFRTRVLKAFYAMPSASTVVRPRTTPRKGNRAPEEETRTEAMH